MAEREDNVYQAKLAEQAERYDGKFVENGKILRRSGCCKNRIFDRCPPSTELP